jgi:hypothetical protein
MTPEEKAEQFANQNDVGGFYDDLGNDLNICQELTAAYLAGYNEAAKWISALIELPEPGVDVLAEFEFGIAIGRRSGNIILDDQAGYQASYWQPINKR